MRLAEAQRGVLRATQAGWPLAPGTIAKQAGVGVATAGRHLRALLALGLVARRWARSQRPGDRAGYVYSLTDAGRAALAAEDEADRASPWMLLRIGYGLGQAATHDLLSSADWSGVIDRMLDVAGQFERVGERGAAAAIRRGVADYRARVHRDPARFDGDVIDGAIVEHLQQLPPAPVDRGGSA